MKEKGFKACRGILPGGAHAPEDISCDLPIKPGKFSFDALSYQLNPKFKFPQRARKYVGKYLNHPMKMKAKYLDKDGKEMICLDATLQVNA